MATALRVEHDCEQRSRSASAGTVTYLAGMKRRGAPLDSGLRAAYHRRVPLTPDTAQRPALTPAVAPTTRRRPATGAEQERRKAWGATVGGMIRDGWQRQQEGG